MDVDRILQEVNNVLKDGRQSNHFDREESRGSLNEIYEVGIEI